MKYEQISENDVEFIISGRHAYTILYVFYGTSVTLEFCMMKTSITPVLAGWMYRSSSQGVLRCWLGTTVLEAEVS